MHRAQVGAVAIKDPAVLVDDGLQKLVHRIGMAGSVHPAKAVVKTLVKEELAPGGGPIGVEAIVAGHLQFAAEIEGGVRIDQ